METKKYPVQLARRFILGKKQSLVNVIRIGEYISLYFNLFTW